MKKKRKTVNLERIYHQESRDELSKEVCRREGMTLGREVCVAEEENMGKLEEPRLQSTPAATVHSTEPLLQLPSQTVKRPLDRLRTSHSCRSWATLGVFNVSYSYLLA